MSTHCQPPASLDLYGTLGTPMGIILVVCLLDPVAPLHKKVLKQLSQHKNAAISKPAWFGFPGHWKLVWRDPQRDYPSVDFFHSRD